MSIFEQYSSKLPKKIIEELKENIPKGTNEAKIKKAMESQPVMVMARIICQKPRPKMYMSIIERRI